MEILVKSYLLIIMNEDNQYLFRGKYLYLSCISLVFQCFLYLLFVSNFQQIDIFSLPGNTSQIQTIFPIFSNIGHCVCVQIRICHEFISIPKPKFLCGDIGSLQYTVASSYVLETHNFHSLAQTSLSLSRLQTHIIEQSHLVKKPLKKNTAKRNMSSAVCNKRNKFFIGGQKKFGGGGTSECGMAQSNKKK